MHIVFSADITVSNDIVTYIKCRIYVRFGIFKNLIISQLK